MTRGLTCNNPMNIMMTQKLWQGEIRPTLDPEHRLCTFDSMQSGIRAGTKVLLAYYRLHGLKTIHTILSRYAPSSENNTEAYADDVCRRIGAQPDEEINLEDQGEMVALVKAMIHHEQGVDCCSDDEIVSGVGCAY